jgi:hypothetical protein
MADKLVSPTGRAQSMPDWQYITPDWVKRKHEAQIAWANLDFSEAEKRILAYYANFPDILND